MATPKRKRNSNHRANTNKNPKYEDSSDHDDVSAQLWEAEAILKERRVGRRLQYLIKWKGTDPATGQDYAPTWEPEDNPNADLLASWVRWKAAEAATTRTRTGSRKNTPRKAQTPRPRKSRVVESSPEALSTAHSSTAPSRASTSSRESLIPAPTVVSSIDTSPAAFPTATSAAQVLIRPPGDFDPEEYERYSQLAASHSPTPTPSTHTQSTSTDLDSSQLSAAGDSSAAPQFDPSGVVQDTQSSAGEGSFIAPTQQTTGTTEPSSTAEVATEDSGLLELVQQAAAPEVPSPARSIPETIYDTADSQSQPRRAASRERTEVPDTLEETQDESLIVPAVEQHGDGELSQPDEQHVVAPEPYRQPEESSTSHEQSASHNSSDITSPGVETNQDATRPEVEREAVYDSSAPAPTPNPETLEGAAQPAAAVASQASLNLELNALSTVLNNLASRRSAQPQGEQDTQSSAVDPTQFDDHVECQDKDQASLAEHSEQDETSQFPFHSQHTYHLFQHFARRAALTPDRAETEVPAATDHIVAGSEALEQTDRDKAARELSATTPDQATSQHDNSLPQSTSSLLVSSTQAEDEDLLSQFLEPEYARSRSPTAAQPTEIEQETVIQSTYATDSIEEVVRRRDFALESQLPHSTDQSTASREQNAQIVPPLNDLSTQEDTTEDIRASIEKEFLEQSSPSSRHDSSQDTPERRLHSADQSSSPIAQPPDHPPGTVDSILPSRPVTPVLTSSLSNMASQDTGKVVEQKLKAMLAEKLAKNPHTPSRRMRKPTSGPASVAGGLAPVPSSAPAPSPSLITSSRRLLRTGADGTRSPSTVPDHSPAPPAPTSLRTVALIQASQPLTEETCEEIPRASSAAPQVEAVEEPLLLPAVPAIVTTEPTAPEPISSEDEHLSDADVDEDNESLLDDELQLDVEEYIVPLFIDGRQSDMYRGELKTYEKVLGIFLQDSSAIQPLEEIEEVLSRLRGIETHLDLVFAEAGASSDDAMDSATQIEFAAQFGVENSTKFSFLHFLFHFLQGQEKHVVLLISSDDDALFSIIETLCRANHFNYNMPTKGRQADPTFAQGDLSITVFQSSMSPIIRPADIIICLDGVQDARQIRLKNWAANPDLELVPILHLVIPRTVGHIERYLSATLNKRERMHTIVASLGHMGSEIGKPIDEDTPRTVEAARLIARWFTAPQADRGLWPITSIGSVKDIIEYQTQGSPTSAASPEPERTKRPHDDEELDPAKRMRFTPQPQPDSSMTEHEITRISDSMPGTATDDASALRAQLARVEEAYQRERAARKAEGGQFREKEIMWEKQQFEHEDLTKKHRLLLGEHQGTEERLATATKNNQTLRERLTTRTEELRTVTTQLSEQRETHLLSDDAKVVEITKLRKDIALATTERDNAVKSKQTSESMREFVQAERQRASDELENSRIVIKELDGKLAKATHVASGEMVVLKKMHIDTQHKELEKQVRILRAENINLKKAMGAKEEELARAKLSGERMGVRTRGTSATPQPGKIRSRAASPRLSGLRNG